ncbi:hypothetical protein EYF80_046302 [Liparis tanakae]|uniref:Uncharacterized protein n=1 Tax=Liparis tanakae TaxID=230148 RepID=A0A4Z2FS20_9TELE|nr:hypothetical protein EYF80_046302 [Liparis tanakae]
MSEVTSYKAAVILAEERGTGGSTGTAEAGAVLRVRRGEPAHRYYDFHIERQETSEPKASEELQLDSPETPVTSTVTHNEAREQRRGQEFTAERRAIPSL